jgi:hypothetical protein
MLNPYNWLGFTGPVLFSAYSKLEFQNVHDIHILCIKEINELEAVMAGLQKILIISSHIVTLKLILSLICQFTLQTHSILY